MLTRECRFGNDKDDHVDSDKTNQQRAGDNNNKQQQQQPTTTSAPSVAAASSSFGSRLPASQIPPPPAQAARISTTKTALPDGSTATSSFYMFSAPMDEDMQSSDSMPGAIHNGLSSAPSRHYRVQALPEDDRDNMIPRPDKTRYHNFPYPHYHIYYDQPRLRDRIFARRWKQEYAKAMKQQEAERATAKPHKHANSEEEDDENDSESLAAAPEATGPLAAAPDTSVDYTSQEKLEAGEQRSRQRRSRYGMYNNANNVDDNDDIDQLLPLPSSSADGHWARYVTNSHSYHTANHPQGTSPKNIEYSYYREVNGPSSTTSATPYASAAAAAAPLDDYRNQIGSSQATGGGARHEPESDYADETRSDRSSAPLNDDDYGDDDGEGGGHGEGTHDDGNDDYGGGGGGDDGSYDDSSNDGSPGYQGQGDGDGGEQQDDNDDFFA